MADPDQRQPPARAVEGQSAEQRAVSRLLDQIAGRIETLAGDVTALGDAVGAVDVDLRQATTLLADRINALSPSIAAQVSTGTHEVLGRVVDALAAERTHALTAAHVAAVVEASELRILAYVDTAVLALAEALLVARRPAGTPGLVDDTPAPSPLAPSPPAEDPSLEGPSLEQTPPAPEQPASGGRRSRWRSAT